MVSGGAACGGMIPVLFGAQRFSTAGGVAVNQSELTIGVAEKVAWTTGDFLSDDDQEALDAPSPSGRRLDVRSGDNSSTIWLRASHTHEKGLYRQLSSFACALGVCCLLHLCGLLYWRVRTRRP